jgi:hypothetical protein
MKLGARRAAVKQVVKSRQISGRPRQEMSRNVKPRQEMSRILLAESWKINGLHAVKGRFAALPNSRRAAGRSEAAGRIPHSFTLARFSIIGKPFPLRRRAADL